jgi:hypothetical protein
VLAPGYLGVERTQSLLPETPIPSQPFIDLGERIGSKTVDPPLGVLMDLDESGLPKHP